MPYNLLLSAGDTAERESAGRWKPKGYRGVEQSVARRAHNPKVTGSSPVPATNFMFDKADRL